MSSKYVQVATADDVGGTSQPEPGGLRLEQMDDDDDDERSGAAAALLAAKNEEIVVGQFSGKSSMTLRSWRWLNRTLSNSSAWFLW